MAKWLSPWDKNTEYDKNQGVVMGGFVYRSTIPNNKGILPYRGRVLSNPFNTLDTTEFEDKLVEQTGAQKGGIEWQVVR